MLYEGFMLITNLTENNNNTKTSLKREKKTKKNMQLFFGQASFLEGEICMFAIYKKGRC
jgi:hypothetical protein